MSFEPSLYFWRLVSESSEVPPLNLFPTHKEQKSYPLLPEWALLMKGDLFSSILYCKVKAFILILILPNNDSP